jgi:Type II secretion system (T2SS), protein M
MNLTERDRKIVMVLAPLVVILGYWFLLLAPQRQAAADAAAKLETEQAHLAEAEGRASTVQAAKTSFAEDYAAMVSLGKAIPTSVDMPSLLVQLEQAAHGTGIKFQGVTVGERMPAAGAAPTGVPPATPGAPDPAAATAPSGQPPQSAPGAAVANAQQTADTASTPPPTADGAATTSTDPAAAGTAGAAPAGALEQVSLEFNFQGDFFELADFFHRLKRFVFVDGDNVRVRGRLMTIDGVEYESQPETFPALNAAVRATVYLTPKAEGVTAGATPTGPGAPPATAAAPVATASSDSGSPTPTATATP